MSKTTSKIIGIVCAPLIVVYYTLAILGCGITAAIHTIINSLKKYF